MKWAVIAIVLVAVLVAVAVYDLLQQRHAVLRNFPVIGHLRYLLERIGPELRQYIVTDNDSERPFSRDQRGWIYASSKRADSTSAFGTDNRFESDADYLVIRHSAFPLPDPGLPRTNAPGHDDVAGKVIGGYHGREGSFRPASFVNLSAMSFGALSAAAVTAFNGGAQLAGCWQSTGEGGLSPYHQGGADLFLQIGTGYFGCRDDDGRFVLSKLVDLVKANPVLAIEFKLSQGAKAGLGGLLPGAKVTPEIAKFRGIPVGKDCHSPPAHTAFHDVASLCEFIETVAAATGVPVGIKSAVGESKFWADLASHMQRSGTGPDFVTIDGGEGGTGAAPLVFADHVSLPFFVGFSSVFREFALAGLSDDIVFIGSGRLGLPERAFAAMALGVDVVAVAREAMLSIGCIQAQRCNTGGCPTGITTQNRWLQHGLEPSLKKVRAANFLATLRYEVRRLAHASGVSHPAFADAHAVGIVSGGRHFRSLAEEYGYSERTGGLAGASKAAFEAHLALATAPPVEAAHSA